MVWLVVLFSMVCGMVLVGGITRLTGSGLSMVEWRPLMGTLPPMGEAEWDRVFGLYQQSPQFKQVNHWMDLAAFKKIFFWEYVHRTLGRLIGMVFFLPWIYFVIRKRMSAALVRRTAIAGVLGGMQGVMGWIMVRSGLVNEPAVSHFRLAAHLMLALLVGLWIFWTLLDLVAKRPGGLRSPGLRRSAWGFVALIALQCVYGAFMAGTRAGWLFSTFPDMNGTMGPAAFMGSGSMVSEFLNNPAIIHWTHRTLAWMATGYAAFLGVSILRAKLPAPLPRVTKILLGLVALQVALGAGTVIFSVPISLAVVHQFCAVAVLCTSVALVWFLGEPEPSA